MPRPRSQTSKEAFLLYREAIRAWISADAIGVKPSEIEKRKAKARQLTGQAISRGLLEEYPVNQPSRPNQESKEATPFLTIPQGKAAV